MEESKKHISNVLSLLNQGSSQKILDLCVSRMGIDSFGMYASLERPGRITGTDHPSRLRTDHDGSSTDNCSLPN
ncbi:hypothetical protein SynRS9902_01209 [Synechococcus sp. RS9902]|nr:hypothetical protein SynRS9902_01209 [Synechococcus sp. RS9902]